MFEYLTGYKNKYQSKQQIQNQFQTISSFLKQFIYLKKMDLSRTSNNSSQIQQFYNEFGIKQYNCFSGGFRYLQKPTEQKPPTNKNKSEVSRQQLYKHFGLTNVKPKTYKMDNQYVPQTKSQLVDKLMEKIEHQRKKMKYYRDKNYGDVAGQYQGKYRQQ